MGIGPPAFHDGLSQLHPSAQGQRRPFDDVGPYTLYPAIHPPVSKSHARTLCSVPGVVRGVNALRDLFTVMRQFADFAECSHAHNQVRSPGLPWQ